MDREVSETLNAAKIYLNNLNTIKSELKSAEKQILSTFEETEKSILETFNNLKLHIVDLLEERQKVLLKEAEEAKRQGLLPLEECMKIVVEKVDNTNHLINLGGSIKNENSKKLEEFLAKSSLLGTLPEVPELKEVPFISFHFEPSYETEFENLCLNFGEIFHISPVQIKQLQQKPGAILVEWDQCFENEDKIRDIQEFRLQRASGDALKNKNLIASFSDCYRGLEMQYLVRDVQIGQPYSFRICCKFDGTSEWSPWSLPQVNLTNIKPFSWKDSSDFLLLNDKKIAQPINDNGTILYSKGPQVSIHDSVEFTILDTDKCEAVIGLIDQEIVDLKNLKEHQQSSFLLDSKGRIFIDGVEKSTFLPEFVKGLKVCFACEQLNGNRLRINVDSNDKRVTYDWTISEHSTFYFACQLMSSSWKIMVE